MTPRSACATCPTCGRRPSERFGAATVEMGVSSLGPDGSFSYQKTGDMPTGGVTARCDDHCHSLADAAPELLAALQAVHDWRGMCDEDILTTWERIAAMFYRDSGMLRPGKDQAAALGGYPTDEQRRTAWDAWVTRKNDELNAQIRAALTSAQEPQK